MDPRLRGDDANGEVMQEVYSKLLLIGVGNRDRGDDGLGPLLAERLVDHKALHERGVYITPHFGEGASLMDLWQGAEKVVIVDAMKSGIDIGTIRRFDVAEEKLKGGTFRYSSHLFSLAEAVELARQLKRLPKSLIIYGIEGKNYAFGEPLSPKVAAALDDVAGKVVAEFVTV